MKRRKALAVSQRPVSSSRLHRPVQVDPALLPRRRALLVVLSEDCCLGLDSEMNNVLQQVTQAIQTCRGKKTRSWSEKALDKVRAFPPLHSRPINQSLDHSIEESTEEVYRPRRVARPCQKAQSKRNFPSARRAIARSQDWRPVIQRSLSSAQRVLGQMRAVIRQLRQL